MDQARHDISQSSASELSHSLDTLVSNWSSLQKKADQKLGFYTDVHKLHEELKGICPMKDFRSTNFFFPADLLQRENVWLDTLQNQIYASAHTSADAEETSEELDVSSKEISLRSNFLRLGFLESRTFAQKSLET